MSLYHAAARVLEGLYEHKGSIKSLVLGDACEEKKRLYGLVCETLKCRLESWEQCVKAKRQIAQL